MRAGRMCTGAIPHPLPLTVLDWCSGAMARRESPCHGQHRNSTMQRSTSPCPKQKQGIWSFSTPPTTPEPTSPMWGCMWEITGCTMPEIPLVTQT